MSKEYNLISDFDYRIIAAFFAGLDRQGPGDDAQTRRALSFIDGLPPRPRIADIGCGTGRQTAVLASALDGPVTVRRPAARNDRGIAPANGDRRPDGASHGHRRLDAVAALRRGVVRPAVGRGSIYNIGFEKGLTQWRRFLKPDGFIAVTECSWLSSARPDEMEFFRDNFPEIDDISGKIRCMERAGYRPVAHFILPDSCWTENYYAPAAARAREFLATYDDAPLARHFVQRFGRGDRAVPSLRPSLRLCLLHRATDRVIRMHTHSEGWQLMLPALVPFGRYRSITPEPTSVSPSYQTANWPGVTPRWGSSKSRYPPSSHTTSSAPCNGWR